MSYYCPQTNTRRTKDYEVLRIALCFKWCCRYVVIEFSGGISFPCSKYEGEMEISHVGLQARIKCLKPLRKLSGFKLTNENILALFINQIPEKCLGVMFVILKLTRWNVPL